MRLRTLTLASLGLAAAVVLAACSSNNDDTNDMANMPGMNQSTTAHQTTGTTSQDMPGTSQDSPASTPTSPTPTTEASGDAMNFNAADVMFATMMIPHHQQAIEMADLVLGKSGVDQQVLTLAQQIKDAQAPEIQTMKGWLQDWGSAYPDSAASSTDGGMGDMSGMPGMNHGGASSTTGMGDMGGMDGGMMSQQDMDALQTATGADAAKLFLTGMISHHQGAIDMAKKELADGQNPDAKALAQNIIDGQTAEIATMQTLLGQK